jgi:hypothetical protein
MGVKTERERQKYFAYLDGVADGLNESRNDVNSVLDKIRAEIMQLDIFYDNDYFSSNKDAMFKCNDILQILDKYEGENEDT